MEREPYGNSVGEILELRHAGRGLRCWKSATIGPNTSGGGMFGNVCDAPVAAHGKPVRARERPRLAVRAVVVLRRAVQTAGDTPA